MPYKKTSKYERNIILAVLAKPPETVKTCQMYSSGDKDWKDRETVHAWYECCRLVQTSISAWKKGSYSFPVAGLSHFKIFLKEEEK